jgi:LPXTG-motif cell wall-anchored protein
MTTHLSGNFLTVALRLLFTAHRNDVTSGREKRRQAPMKKALLMLIVLTALPLTALLAQSDPATAPANDPPAAQADPADPNQPAPADQATSPTDTPTRDDAADPNAANADPDANRNLPATASHGPLILLMGILAIGMFLVLKVFRRRSVDVS